MPETVKTSITWLSINASYSHSSFALASIHANTKLHDQYEWSQVTATIKDDKWGILTRLLESAPDIIAGTLYLFNRNLLIECIRCFKRLRPHVKVILGGPEFLGDNELFLNDHPEVAAVFRGEAELTFDAFLKAGDKLPQWTRITGLCWLDKKGEYHDNGLAKVPAPLDRVASPLNSKFYNTDKPFVSLETSRGCPSRCKFCTSSCFGNPRYLSLTKFARDLERLQQVGVHEIRILDRTFNLPATRCVQLLRIMHRYASHLRFHIEINPAALTESVLAELHNFPRGKLHVEAGLQTGNPAALEAVERLTKPECTWNGLQQLCAINGLDVHVDLVAGLPEVSLQDINRDLKRLARIKPDEIQLELLKLLPGTLLHKNAEAYGLVYNSTPPYEVLETPCMNFADLNEVRLLSRGIDAFYNDIALRAATRQAIVSEPDFLHQIAHLTVDNRGEPVPASRKRRFALIHDALSAAPQIQAQLQYAWMREGLSGKHGLVKADRWKGQIPADATWRQGDATILQKPCRIWHCSIAQQDYWFVYTRERQQKRAVAVFCRS